MNILEMEQADFYEYRSKLNAEVRGIHIPDDINPGIAIGLVSLIDEVYTRIRLDLVDIENAVNRVESTIREWERSKASGSSDTQRKKNATEALQNFDNGDGSTVNMYDVLRTLSNRENSLKAILDALSNKQSRLVTVTGLLKIDKDLTNF